MIAGVAGVASNSGESFGGQPKQEMPVRHSTQGFFQSISFHVEGVHEVVRRSMRDYAARLRDSE